MFCRCEPAPVTPKRVVLVEKGAVRTVGRNHGELDHGACTPTVSVPMWPSGSVAMCPGVTLLMRKCRCAALRASAFALCYHYQHYGLGRGVGDNGVRLTELRRGIAGERQRRSGASEGPIRALGYGRQLTRRFVSC
jgi:hypothetical protein